MALVNANYNNYDNCGAWPRAARRYFYPPLTSLSSPLLSRPFPSAPALSLLLIACLINIPGHTRGNDYPRSVVGPVSIFFNK